MFFFGPEFIYMVRDIVGSEVGSEVGNALVFLTNSAAVMLWIMAGMSIHAENIIAQNAEYIHKKNSRSKFTWIYIALPVGILAVGIGLVTNAWSPIFPILFLICVLMVTVCKQSIEKRESK